MSERDPDAGGDLDPIDDVLLERVVVGALRPDAPEVAARAKASPPFAAALAETLALQGTLDAFGRLARATVAEAAEVAEVAAPGRDAPSAGTPPRSRLRLLAPLLAAAALLAALLWHDAAPPRAPPSGPLNTPSTGGPELLGLASIDFARTERPLEAGRPFTFDAPLPPSGWWLLTWRRPGASDAPPLLERRLEEARFVPTEADLARVPADLAEVEVRVVAFSADGAPYAVGVLRCALRR